MVAFDLLYLPFCGVQVQIPHHNGGTAGKGVFQEAGDPSGVCDLTCGRGTFQVKVSYQPFGAGGFPAGRGPYLASLTISGDQSWCLKESFGKE